jgi:hypothetical protein
MPTIVLNDLSRPCFEPFRILVCGRHRLQIYQTVHSATE